MKVLIFSVTAGNGHNSTAKLLTNKFKKLDENNEIKTVDVFYKYASPIRAWAIDKGYNIACNNFVWLYNYFFGFSERSKIENKNIAGVHNNIWCILKGILDEINEYKPDLIICTHVFVAVALTDLRKVYDIPCKVVGLMLDYGVSPYWECCNGVDYMFLTNEGLIDTFVAKGFSPEQLYPVGIPIGDNFSKDIDRFQACEELGLDKELFTLIIMKGAFFSMSNKKIFSELKKIKQKIQVVIINGKSQKSKNEIDKIVATKPQLHKVVNVGFTDKVGYYFSAGNLILGKGGGLSTTEALTKALPTLIIDGLPKQEIYNKDYLIETGCALSVDKKHSISSRIQELITDKNKYNKMVENCKRTRKLNVGDKIIDILKNVPKAQYNSELILNKKVIIKNVKRALMFAHKEVKLQAKNQRNKSKVVISK